MSSDAKAKAYSGVHDAPGALKVPPVLRHLLEESRLARVDLHPVPIPNIMLIEKIILQSLHDFFFRLCSEDEEAASYF